MRELLFCACLASCPILFADVPFLKVDEVKSGNPRIKTLLVDVFLPLCVEPAIPHDFVAMKPEGATGYDWFYWGPKKVLLEYFRDRNSLSEPILGMRLSWNVAQVGPDKLSIEDENVKELIQSIAKDAKLYHYKWGTYPVVAIEGEMLGKPCCVAWIGMQSPEGWTLQCNLITPQTEEGIKQGKVLWRRFMTDTSALKEPECYKAAGFDLQEGVTLVDQARSKLQAFAERRKSDGKLQVVVLPLDPLVTFTGESVSVGYMGGSWRRGKPLVKVSGLIFKKEQDGTELHVQTVISILIKEVEDFSHDQKTLNDAYVYQSNV